MKSIFSALCVFAILVVAVGPVRATVTPYTNEAEYLTDIATLGVSVVHEGFEDDTVWGPVRSSTAPSITNLGITWMANNANSEVTTGSGPALTGNYGFYTLPDEMKLIFADDFSIAGDLVVSSRADFDADGDDFLQWQTGFGITSGAQKSDGDYDNDGDVDGDDFLGWQVEFGSGGGTASAAVPEPTSVLLLLSVAVVGMFPRLP